MLSAAPKLSKSGVSERGSVKDLEGGHPVPYPTRQPDYAGFDRSVPHFAYLPFASRHRVGAGAGAGDLMYLPFASRHCVAVMPRTQAAQAE
jgi:hypothetical protein